MTFILYFRRIGFHINSVVAVVSRTTGHTLLIWKPILLKYNIIHSRMAQTTDI